MLDLGIPYVTVNKKVVKAYNVNASNPTLKKGGVARWDSQRVACLNGVRKVYGRPLEKWDRSKKKFVKVK